jgi:hypothetical protein
MMRPATLAGAVKAAELRVAERQYAVRARGRELAAQVHGQLSSPVVLVAAAGTGFLLASRGGRRLFGRVFSGLQLALAVLSAARS